MKILKRTAAFSSSRTLLAVSTSQGDIDNSDFLETDIPAPHMLRVPQAHSYSEVHREEIRELVLEVRSA